MNGVTSLVVAGVGGPVCFTWCVGFSRCCVPCVGDVMCTHCSSAPLVCHMHLLWLKVTSFLSIRTSWVSCVEMFATTLLPSLSVHGAWTSVKDVCGWAVVDDALWEQFAGHLGDV